MLWWFTAWRTAIGVGILVTLAGSIYLVMCALMPAGTMLYGSIVTKDPSPATVGLVAMFAAIAGWLTTAYVSRIGSIKQHTMQVLTQSRLSAEMGGHLREFHKAFPGNQTVPASDVTAANRSTEWFRAALYILNYYEFLAVAMRHGDIHEPLLRDCVRSIFLNYYKRMSPIIEYAVRADTTPGALAHTGDWHSSPSGIYKDIRRLRARWDVL